MQWQRQYAYDGTLSLAVQPPHSLRGGARPPRCPPPPSPRMAMGRRSPHSNKISHTGDGNGRCSAACSARTRILGCSLHPALAHLCSKLRCVSHCARMHRAAASCGSARLSEASTTAATSQCNRVGDREFITTEAPSSRPSHRHIKPLRKIRGDAILAVLASAWASVARNGRTRCSQSLLPRAAAWTECRARVSAATEASKAHTRASTAKGQRDVGSFARAFVL